MCFTMERGIELHQIEVEISSEGRRALGTEVGRVNRFPMTPFPPCFIVIVESYLEGE